MTTKPRNVHFYSQFWRPEVKIGTHRTKCVRVGTHSHGKYQGESVLCPFQPWWLPIVCNDQGCLEEEYHRMDIYCKREFIRLAYSPALTFYTLEKLEPIAAQSMQLDAPEIPV